MAAEEKTTTTADGEAEATTAGPVWQPMWVARGAARLLPSPTTTPLATAMVLLLLFASLLLRLHPGDVGAVVAWASTNVHNLDDHPVAAMVSSTFVMTGSPVPNLVIVGIGFAVLERAVGPGRTLLVALAGQVIPTLLTEYGIELGAHLHLLATSSVERPDVGVSYVMYAVLTAATISLPRPAQLVGLLIVGCLVLYPFLSDPGMTPTGHVLAVAIGAAAMTTFTRSVRHEGDGPSRLRRPQTRSRQPHDSEPRDLDLTAGLGQHRLAPGVLIQLARPGCGLAFRGNLDSIGTMYHSCR